MYNVLPSGAYDVGTGRARAFEDICDILMIAYTHSKHVPKNYQFFTCANKTKWLPGWQPKYSLEEGLKEYREEFRALQETVPD